MFTSKRKAAYEALHPETANGATGKGRSKVGQVGQANASFADDTADKTGQSARKVRVLFAFSRHSGAYPM